MNLDNQQTQPIHVLLVEDNEGDILLIKEALMQAQKPHQFDICRNGMQAMEWLENQTLHHPDQLPDLIFLDINLPKKNGQEVLQFIKGNAAIRHIPVIMLTTSSYQNDILTSYQNMANCYITKPVDASAFMETIAKVETFWLEIAQLPQINPAVS
jgi:chemotaxis family two-component system response regulator Rcp1